VVYVETPGEAPHLIDAEDQRRLFANIEKARELGAEVIQLQAKDPVAAVMDFARSHGVGHVMIGRTRPTWRHWFRPTIMQRFVDEAEGFDLHIVSLDDEGNLP
jgi:two-component system sensor histidine kinase KdpD